MRKVIFIFCCILLLGFTVRVSFAQNTTPILQSDLQILHHEPLQFIRIDPTVAKNIDSETDGDKAITLVVEFQAFGRYFELELAPNDRLIADLPRQQKDQLVSQIELYRGRIKDIPESWVRLTRIDDHFSGMLWDGVEVYLIDHSSEVDTALVGASKSQTPQQVIYRLSDIELNTNCAVDPNAQPLNDYREMVEHLKDLVVPSLPAATQRLDIAAIADSQFIQINSNPQAAVIARMNVVDGIYAEQVGVTLNIVEIRQLSNNGILTSTSPGTLLNQLGQFASSAGFNNPGLAHLFTGRNLNGGTIGIAYLGSLCSDRFGVGLSQVRGTGTAGALTVAHEIGHNFGAPHDNQGGSPCASTPNGFLMNPFLNGSDQLSQCSLRQIQPNVDSASCIRPISTNPTADVRVSLPTNPISATVDTNFSYRVEVRNRGTAIATDVGAVISLPAAFLLQQAIVPGGGCTANATSVVCDLPDLPGGSERLITMTLQSDTAGQFTSNVNVSAANDNDTSNNRVQASINISGDNNGGDIVFSANFNDNVNGFSYRDDAFGTNQPFYASGQFLPTGGFSGGSLRVLLGGRNTANIFNMSGGWQRSFSLSSAQRVVVSFRYRLAQASNYESDEFSDALIAIDGRVVGNAGNNFIARLRGDGNGGSVKSTGWVAETIDLGVLSSGNHTLTIGGFNNKKTWRDELTAVRIDDVTVERR